MMVSQEIDAMLGVGAAGNTKGDLMAFERLGTRGPMHMRRESLADTNGQLFSNIRAAIDYAQNGVVVLQRDHLLTEPLTISSPGMTLDLNGHTLAVGNPHATPSQIKEDPVLLRIAGSGIRIRNGRILIASGAWQGIRVEGKVSNVNLLLEDVNVTYKGSGYALMVLEGSAVLIDSLIASTGSGVHLAQRGASLSMLRSQVIGVQCGVSLWDGRLLVEDSSVQGRHAHGLFIKNGWADVSFSTISSFQSQALAVRAASSSPTAVIVRIRNGSQIDAKNTSAALLQGGTITVEGSMLRSISGSVVEMGISGYGVSDEVLGATQLTLQKGSTVSSWRGDGIRRCAGELTVDESCTISVTGNGVADDLPFVVGKDGPGPSQTGESEALPEGNRAGGSAPADGADASASSHGEGERRDGSDDDADEQGDAQGDDDILLERPISRVRIDGVREKLDARKSIEFGATLGSPSKRSRQAEILFEQWSDGTDVITSDETRAPLPESTYHYILALRALDGYVFPNYFDVVYKGTSVGHSVMISLDRKIAMVSWGLSVTVSRNRNRLSPLELVRKSDVPQAPQTTQAITVV